MDNPRQKTMNYQDELELAIQVAQGAGKIQLEGRLSGFDVSLKEDKSPVTAIDKNCEEYIRSSILAQFPDDGFLGEESRETQGTSGRKWIVDPLDGTRPYVRGIPTFSSLIALEQNGDLLLGVMHFAGMRETYWASRGSGAFCNRQRIGVSDTDSIDHAMGSALGVIEESKTRDGKRLFEYLKSLDYVYGFMDAYTYAAVASGKLDIAINLMDKAWDCAAGACIVAEAGGEYSDLHGNHTVHGGAIVLSNRRLHQGAIEHFKGD